MMLDMEAVREGDRVIQAMCPGATVAQLIEILKRFPPDAEVCAIVYSEGEGVASGWMLDVDYSDIVKVEHCPSSEQLPVYLYFERWSDAETNDALASSLNPPRPQVPL
jgi:hypothetical protein